MTDVDPNDPFQTPGALDAPPLAVGDIQELFDQVEAETASRIEGKAKSKFEPDQAIGPWTLVEFLGRGGTGEVWHAIKTEAPEEAVALKIPLRPAFLRHLRQEGLFLEKVAHPNVARFIEADLNAETPWLATELIEGTPLRALCRGTIKTPAATLICDQLLAGLEAIHDAGILHLDLKPENVIVQSDGRVKIVDLGLGRATTAFMEEVYLSVSLVSRVPPVAGTLAYMAPEQRKGKPTDPRTDLFAFGILLHELLTGELPKPGGGVLSIRPELAPRWDAAIAAFTHPNPNLRPANARAARHRVAFTLTDKRKAPVVRGGHEPRDLTRFDEEAFALASPYVPGMVIGDGYELVALLGRGGFGEVWRARREEDEVALKLVLSDAAEPALKREAEIAAKVEHPGIPKLLADHTDQRPPHVVFELVEGLSLRLLIHEEQRVPLSSLCRLFSGMLDAVGACARAEVVHMDLKPEHFLVRWRGEEAEVSLIDFGLAAHLPEAAVQDSLTSKAEIRGTLDYMAPEQRKGEVGPKVDVYALGVCFFELLTFNLPKGPQRPRSLRREIPRELDDLIVAMLSARPGERPTLQAAQRIVDGYRPAHVETNRATVRVNPLTHLLYPLRQALKTPIGIMAALVLTVAFVVASIFAVPTAYWSFVTRGFETKALKTIAGVPCRDVDEVITNPRVYPRRRGKVLIVTQVTVNSRMGPTHIVRIPRQWRALPSDIRAESPTEVGTLVRILPLGDGKRATVEVVDFRDRRTLARYTVNFDPKSDAIARLVSRFPRYRPPPPPSAKELAVVQANERSAIALLQRIAELQADLRRPARRIGELAQDLGFERPAKLGDPLVRQGYLFRVKSSSKVGLWMAVAEPLEEGETGRYFFAVTYQQNGVGRSRFPIDLDKHGRVSELERVPNEE